MGHEHARGMDVDQRDAALAGDGLHDVLAVNGLGDDRVPSISGLRELRIKNRDIALDGRNHR